MANPVTIDGKLNVAPGGVISTAAEKLAAF